MEREPNPRLVMMMGRDMPFLPAAPPDWFSRRILQHYPSASVVRFGPIPTEFGQCLNEAYKTNMDMLADLVCLRPSQIPMVAIQELDQNVSLFFLALTDEVSEEQYVVTNRALAYAAQRWYEEFPEEKAQMEKWVDAMFKAHAEKAT